jgi:hypothetical protein
MVNADPELCSGVPYYGTPFLNHRTNVLNYGTLRQLFYWKAIGAFYKRTPPPFME